MNMSSHIRAFRVPIASFSTRRARGDFMGAGLVSSALQHLLSVMEGLLPYKLRYSVWHARRQVDPAARRPTDFSPLTAEQRKFWSNP